MTAQAAKLPAAMVDQLFRRLVATYGRRFWQQWEGVEPADVKAVWARELAGYENRPEVFAWAFENLPEQPMNAIEFRALCRRAPARQNVAALPRPALNPEKAAMALQQARAAFAIGSADRDGLAWARNIIERKERGEQVGVYALREAKAALERADRLLKPAFCSENNTESNTTKEIAP